MTRNPPPAPVRARRSRQAVLPLPSGRLFGRLGAAAGEIELWLERLEVLPGPRAAPLAPDLPPQVAATIELARRAAGRGPGRFPAPDWGAGRPVSNTDATIALLKARVALGDLAEHYEARLADA